ncbi:MAG: FMN-binding protein, partial [Ruminococcus sp.]|nr:FMN-binding protein [Ruminococcus sp.]
DAISGATFSSKGMRKAVAAAMDVYNENKEAILSGR